MSQDDPSPAELYIRGRNALKAGNTESALDLIGSAVAGNPDNSGWRVSFGHLLLNDGLSESALEQFDEALRLGPESAKLQLFRGRAMAEQELYLDAWRAYLRATELESDSVAAWISLGKFAVERNDLDSARIAYRSVLAIETDHVSAHVALAGIAADRNDVNDEVRHREAVADLKPDHIPSQMLAGACLIKVDRLSDARARYQRVADLQPEHAGATAIAEELTRWIDEGVPKANVVSVDYYNAIYLKSASYRRDGGELEEAEHFATICELLQRDGATRVLDVGCGPGQFAQYLRKYSPVPYVGVDYSDVAIGQARERAIPDTDFRIVDVVSEGLPDMPVGTSIVCTEVLEHILEDIELVRRFPVGSHCYCSVPSFHTFGHLRRFASGAEVEQRYSEFFEGFEVKEIPIGAGVNRLFVFSGVRVE